MDSMLLLDLKLGSQKEKKRQIKLLNTILLFDCSCVNMMLLYNISLE